MPPPMCVPLQQRRRPADPWQPLGFFSRKLDSTQVKYSAFDRELLAEFTSDIQHIAGTDNVVADTLSRPPGGATAGSG